jgi:hypothetical protein
VLIFIQIISYYIIFFEEILRKIHIDYSYIDKNTVKICMIEEKSVLYFFIHIYFSKRNFGGKREIKI